jgi:hypothetical protein
MNLAVTNSTLVSLTVNFNNLGQTTDVKPAYWKNRNGALVGLDGTQIRGCTASPAGEDLLCSLNVSRVEGKHKLSCTTNKTAAKINDTRL